MSKRFNLIVAFDKNNAIGKQNTLPWGNLSHDLQRFKELTKNKTILMGRKTWDSLPHKPLKDRKNVILTSSAMNKVNGTHKNLIFNDNLEWCMDTVSKDNGFVIGGQDLYTKALDDPRIDKVYVTKIDKSFNGCDAFFPTDKLTKDKFRLTYESTTEYKKGIPYKFQEYKRRNDEELSYLNLLRNVLDYGIVKDDRTETGIKSLFAPNKLEFDLSHDKYPLLTTKKVFFKGVAEELFWFLRGSVDVRELQRKGIHFWDDNSTNKFLSTRKLGAYGENTIGLGYGHQIRHWGGKHHFDTKFSIGGIDQVQQLIDTIKTDPNSRRLILSAWNVSDLDKMALPPCHFSPVQFWVNTDTNELSCQWYQRSADLFLGVPFNIASYALLTKLVAKETGLKAKKIIGCFGDAHIYQNHIDAVKEQISREPKKFPELEFKRSCKNKNLELSTMRCDRTCYNYKDFKITGYEPFASIKAKMAI
jgi:dihydrofolate reductase/thymidylate synthase